MFKLKYTPVAAGRGRCAAFRGCVPPPGAEVEHRVRRIPFGVEKHTTHRTAWQHCAGTSEIVKGMRAVPVPTAATGKGQDMSDVR